MEYRCGYCSRDVASEKCYIGQISSSIYGLVYICPNCRCPSFFDLRSGKVQIPGAAFGNDVGNLPADVAGLYAEARRALSVDANTASVMATRKILMNVAVSKGALVGQNFMEYVAFLDSKGYVPPDGHGWVDHIRTRGNEANHEITLMTRSDAEELLTFVEMLLRFVYEFPGRVPSVAKTKP